MQFFGKNEWDSPAWMRDAGQGGYANYGNALAEMYGPQAYNRAIAGWAENFDRQMGNNRWGQTMGQRGFGGSANTGLIRSGAMAQNRMDTRQMFNQGKLGGYQNQMQMLSGLAGLYHRTYSPGIADAIGQAAGEARKMGQQVSTTGTGTGTRAGVTSDGMGITGWNGQNPYVPMTATQGVQPYNFNEGGQQSAYYPPAGFGGYGS